MTRKRTQDAIRQPPNPLSDIHATTHRDFWLVLLVALVFLIAAFQPGIDLYDEGIILVGAESVFAGKLPYKDFWTMYGPGQFYLSSWLFSVFGVSTLPVRGVGLLAKSLIVALAFVAIRRTSSRVPAFIGAAIIAGFLVREGQSTFPVFPATALAIGALLLLDRGRRGHPFQLVAAGLLTGLVACFRHDLGAYAAAAATLALCIDGGLRGEGEGAAIRMRVIAKSLGCYLLGILAIALPVAAFFLAKVPFSDLYENLIYIPSKIYPAVRSLPWPDPGIARAIFNRPQAVAPLAVYVPFVVGAAALLLEVGRWKSRKAEVGPGPFGESGSFLVLLVALTCLLFTAKGFVRVSNHHMAQALVLAMILLPAVLIGAIRQGWSGPTRSRGGALAVVVVLMPAIALVSLLACQGFGAAWRGIERFRLPDAGLVALCRSPQLPRMRCVDTDPNYISAARFVAEHSDAADRIYVGAGRHDKLFVNAVAFYFLAARQPATKWYELHPGVQTQRRVQQAMVDEMTASPPRFIVLDSRWDGKQEPNQSRLGSGVVVLDEYIASRYSDVAQFGPIRVLAPR